MRCKLRLSPCFKDTYAILSCWYSSFSGPLPSGACCPTKPKEKTFTASIDDMNWEYVCFIEVMDWEYVHFIELMDWEYTCFIELMDWEPTPLAEDMEWEYCVYWVMCVGE
jgi:hypothetical protein